MPKGEGEPQKNREITLNIEAEPQVLREITVDVEAVPVWKEPGDGRWGIVHPAIAASRYSD